MKIVVLLLLPLIVYTLVLAIRYSRLKKVVEGSNKPELWLSRSDRREHARKLLRREDDEYTQKIIEQTTTYLKGQPSQ